MVDDHACDQPGMDNPKYRMWNLRTNRLVWKAYLSGGANPDIAVPARRADLSGLAPAWLGVGTLDPLFTEGIEYARRLVEFGVPCDVDTVRGAFHGFDAVAPSAPVSRAFFERQCEVLQQYL
ncbi:hypothetical protein AWB94_10870 [Mycolicibacterium canariasense]|nr:alpha/beta hydrolase fold domain-containing protein [Mycolicibacterium canariasense]ORV08712.1 hypothetical protein AWB94_10870 [Mycolicibacterium canariasense]